MRLGAKIRSSVRISNSRVFAAGKEEVLESFAMKVEQKRLKMFNSAKFRSVRLLVTSSAEFV